MSNQDAIDLEVIETLKVLMKDRFSYLIETFIKKSQDQFADLKKAIESNNVDDIVSITHSLKGSAGSVGANSMHQLCKTYESAARDDQLSDVDSWPDKLLEEYNRYCEAIKAHL